MQGLDKIIAGDVIWRNFFSEEELALNPYSCTADIFFERLQKKKLYLAMINFIATCMPHRESVWWGCRCYSAGYKNESPANRQLLAKILAWVKEPTGAKKPVKVLAPDAVKDPLKWLEFSSSFYLGEELPLPQSSSDKILPDIAAIANSAAISMLAVKLATDKAQKVNGSILNEWFNKFIKLGLNIAAGKDSWDYL